MSIRSTNVAFADNGSRLVVVAKFRKRKFSVTTEFLAKDKRDFTTYFAIAFKPMLCDAFLFINLKNKII